MSLTRGQLIPVWGWPPSVSPTLPEADDLPSMPPANSIPLLPDPSQRLAARMRPAGKPVMYQRWRDLLFLHWEYPASAIQATLPDGLFVDSFGGRAYLGVVPFFMQGIRPRFLPAVPGVSDFLELNLRTYVHDRAGVPGVWFYSLDANQWLAVKIARRFFHLPYEHAAMQSSRTEDEGIHFESRRNGGGDPSARCVYEYAVGAELPLAAPGSLEFFLVERYRLYSRSPHGLRRGAVHHEPYPLRRAKLTTWDENLLRLDGFAPTGRPPDHVLHSPGVDVGIFPLERVSQIPDAEMGPAGAMPKEANSDSRSARIAPKPATPNTPTQVP